MPRSGCAVRWFTERGPVGVRAVEARMIRERKMKRVAAIAALCLIWPAVSCDAEGGDEPIADQSTSNASVDPLYVSALCEALLRYQSTIDLRRMGVDTSLTRALVIRSLNATRDGLSTFADDLEALGPPPIEGGDQLLDAWRNSLDKGVQAIEAKLDDPHDLPTSAEETTALLQEVLTPALGVPSAMGVLFGSWPTRVSVFLEEPVDPGTVERLTSLLEDDPEVARTRYDDKDAVCAQLQEMIAEGSIPFEALDCGVLPPAIRVWLSDPDATPDVIPTIQGETGVRSVSDERDGLSQIYDGLEMSQEHREGFQQILDAAISSRACEPLVRSESL